MASSNMGLVQPDMFVADTDSKEKEERDCEVVRERMQNRTETKILCHDVDCSFQSKYVLCYI